MANEFVDFVSEELRAQGKSLPQQTEASRPEPKVTEALVTEAAEKVVSELGKIQVKTRAEILRSEFENPPAPVNAQGTLDHKFLAMIKQVVVWTDETKTIPDLEKSLQLRALAYEGYEKAKGGKTIPERPVSDGEILEAIQARVERAHRSPEIVKNRHVHTS